MQSTINEQGHSFISQIGIVHKQYIQTREGDADDRRDGPEIDAELAVLVWNPARVEEQVEDVDVRRAAQQPHIHHHREEHPQARSFVLKCR